MTNADALPARITEVIGHRRQVAQLDRIAQSGNLPVAMVLTGPTGVGRRTLGLRFAAASVCLNAVDGRPCGTCRSCARVVTGNHSDVQIWSVGRQDQESGPSKSGTLTIETIRRISSSTALRPFEAERRFILIEDAETLGDAAQQAFLKTLEDAPGYATIILIAESAGALLDTVRSRCLHIPLQLVPTAEIVNAMEASEAEEIARLAMGRPGWARRALADLEWREQHQAKLQELELWISATKGDRLIEAYRRGDRFTRDRSATLDALDQVTIMLRDVLLTQAGATDISFDPDRAGRIAARFRSGTQNWHRALVAAQQCVRDLTGNVRPRLAMQQMVTQWPIQS
jgi:DNA polymerase-3 subunit delta'